MIPTKIKHDIKISVFQKADAHDYMNRTRPENRLFMQDLVEDADVGGKLASYMEKSEIKTYIKDAILNAYSKTKLGPPEDLKEILKREVGEDCEEIEDLSKNVSLYTGKSGKAYIVACGTYLKWESALRKALENVACLRKGAQSEVVLVLSIQTRHATTPDMELTKKALAGIGVRCVFARV
jgi:hypothetical protein